MPSSRTVRASDLRHGNPAHGRRAPRADLRRGVCRPPTYRDGRRQGGRRRDGAGRAVELEWTPQACAAFEVERLQVGQATVAYGRRLGASLV
ncbi:hypothetical protein FHT02_001052 [Sphingomonas xinjiangensis]|uniref:Uncharacterized protein n=1 Tax=Sphingomonas xinjiangensis TaxID=643568 RepID=A0A840YKZ7_9SPHN|nr:hypothetical protein [Sphingomonas xinjiangensis]